MNSIYSIKIGEQLMAKRIDKGMSQQEVADRLNVSDVTISRYEKGQRDISMPMFFKMCDIYQTDAYQLLDEVRKYVYKK